VADHPNITGIYGFRLTLSGDVEAQLKGGGGWILQTVVPVDAALERWAHVALRSKDGIEREEGAEALGYFPSPANIAQLKELLSDATLSAGSPTLTYYVRQAAYNSLKKMGVAVPEPVLRIKAGQQ
jgi:hypothetical protein